MIGQRKKAVQGDEEGLLTHQDNEQIYSTRRVQNAANTLEASVTFQRTTLLNMRNEHDLEARLNEQKNYQASFVRDCAK